MHETITASEQVMKCNNKKCSNRGNPIRSAELQSIAISHMTYGIDIIAHAGDALTKELHQELGKELKKSGVQTEVKRIQRDMNKKKRQESKVII